MAIRYSTGLVDFLNDVGSFKRAFVNGVLEVRTGSQPTSADDAVSGTLLNTYTNASGSWTAETRPAASLTLTGGSSGSVDSVTIGGYEVLGAVVPYNTSLTQTAADVAAQINKYCAKGFAEVTASSSSGKVTITACQGSGNISGTIVVTTTTLTHTEVNMGTEVTGVNPANGLQFATSSGGVLAKSGTWSGEAVATGTAGWFRLKGSIADGGGSSSTLVRMDGSCGTSSADMIMASTTITSGLTYTIDTATFTLALS